MGTQNLNNFYFNKLDSKLDYSSYYDIFLTSDEKDFNTDVVYSSNIIDYNNQNSLAVWIDLNSTESSTQPATSCQYQYPTGNTIFDYYTNPDYRPFVILSKLNVSWTKAKIICVCPYTGNVPFKVCDTLWTATDNGLFNETNFSANTCLNLYPNLPASNTFNLFDYDKRFKMHQVKAFGVPFWNNTFYTDTTIMGNSDYSGYYQDLKGGFYQGFYKLYGYPYEILPTRPNKGWSFESYLKLNTIANIITSNGVDGNCYNVSGWKAIVPGGVGGGGPLATTLCSQSYTLPYTTPPSGPPYQLNYSSFNAGAMFVGKTDKYGFFFYKGIRAEDKYFHTSDFSEDQLSCTTITGITGCCNTVEDPVKIIGQNKSPDAQHDVYSNAIGFRITDDMKIGYRTIRYTGECRTTGETCNSATSFTCGYGIEESYSESLCNFITQSGNCVDTWIQVDVVFERNLYLEDCEIYNSGGINDLVKVRTDKFQRYGTHVTNSGGPFGCNPVNPSPNTPSCNDEYPRFIEEAYFDFNCHGAHVESWFDEKEYRLGTLSFYVNGRRVHKVENFEEIIPRQLNTNKQTQVGVSYNMSWGGGALGLRENLVAGNLCKPSETFLYNKELQSDQKLIKDNFAGSFIGGISQMMYYIKPLTADEIYHNFKINKTRYKLIDCEVCENCNNGCIDCDLPT